MALSCHGLPRLGYWQSETQELVFTQNPRTLGISPRPTLNRRGFSQSVLSRSDWRRRVPVAGLLHRLWFDEQGQDIAEYAVMLAVILVIVVGTIRLIGSNANNVFSSVGSAIQ